jgi:hypothetical protein
MAERIMQIAQAVFAQTNSTAKEEAFMAVGGVANAIGEGFLHFLPAFAPSLMRGLSNHSESQVGGVSGYE